MTQSGTPVRSERPALAIEVTFERSDSREEVRLTIADLSRFEVRRYTGDAPIFDVALSRSFGAVLSAFNRAELLVDADNPILVHHRGMTLIPIGAKRVDH